MKTPCLSGLVASQLNFGALGSFWKNIQIQLFIITDLTVFLKKNVLIAQHFTAKIEF